MPLHVNNPHAQPNAAEHGRQPAERPPIPGRQVKDHPKKRVNIRIATLNINGASASSHDMDHIDKWSTINSTIKDQKIAVLALQETHLDDTRMQDINRCFSKSLETFNSSDPRNPRTTAGVAIVLNRVLIAMQNVQTYNLKKGCAIFMKLKWADTEEISILNIYAPNDGRHHPDFWKNLECKRRRKHLPKPDFVLGDFNLTEDPIDRSPPKEGNRRVIEALREARTAWGTQDQWRHDHLSSRVFTHKHITNGEYEWARLDRIYAQRAHTPKLFKWEAGPSCH